MRAIIDIICIILAASVSFIGGYILGQYNEQQKAESEDTELSKAEYDKLVHLMKCGSLQSVDTGRLDGKCEDVIPLEDAIAIIDKVYKVESENTE